MAPSLWPHSALTIATKALCPDTATPGLEASPYELIEEAVPPRARFFPTVATEVVQGRGVWATGSWQPGSLCLASLAICPDSLQRQRHSELALLLLFF